MESESSTNAGNDLGSVEIIENMRATEAEFGLNLLASTLAHEIRNPLQSIRLQVDALERGGDLSGALARIGHEVSRIEAVVEKVQKLGQKYVVHPERINLKELIDSTLSSIGFWLNAAGIQVRVYSHWEGDPIVFADRELIEQVLLNLMMNAVQAMPDGGVLTVSISEATSDALIEVSDTGFGISSDALKIVGTPFYTTKENGHGLGLAFCKTIASLHKGSLEIESAESHGTQVTLRLSKSLAPSEEVGNA